jgi:hypothetical protein
MKALKLFFLFFLYFTSFEFSLNAQTVDFNAVIPLLNINRSVEKINPKKESGFWRNLRVTCKSPQGAILRQGHKDFNDCLNNSGRFSGPREKIEKSIDFMIEINFERGD